MKKNVLIILLICSTFSIAIIIALFIQSNRLNHGSNNFVRLIPSHFIENPKILDLKYNSYYIAGGTAENIYLGNTTAPAHIVVTNHFLTDSQHIQLQLPLADSIFWVATSMSIDSPNIYLLDRAKPSIIRGTFTNLETKSFRLKGKLTSLISPINPNSFTLVTYDVNLQRKILIKERLDSPYVKSQPNALIKQIDGSFCTDGMLHYSKDINRLIYVYYYRNQFICMDTNLNVTYRGKTIDTVSHAQIKIAQISSEHATTFEAPPLTVNERSCVFKDKLFINSSLRAKNEDPRSFEVSSVIDVYSLKNGLYEFSFYIPKHEGKKLRGFQVLGNTLVAIYDHHLLSYQLDLNQVKDYFN